MYKTLIAAKYFFYADAVTLSKKTFMSRGIRLSSRIDVSIIDSKNFKIFLYFGYKNSDVPFKQADKHIFIVFPSKKN